jgi:hypothetical protein
VFSLELSAVDVVVERLGLPRHWQPFDIPHVGTTVEERKRHTEQVWEKLRSAGLAGQDRLDAETEQAMQAWTRPEVLVVVRADQVVGQQLVLYRAAAANGVGVLSELVGDQIEFEALKADQLIGLVAAQLPPLGPVPLREVSVIGGSATAPAEPDDGPLARYDEPSADMRAMRAFASWPVQRFGSFELSIRKRDGRLGLVGIVQFVDTDGGRFVIFTTALPNGQRRMSFVPSDGSHIRRWLHEQLAIARDERS